MSIRLLPLIILISIFLLSACSSGSGTTATGGSTNTGSGATSGSIIDGTWTGSYTPPLAPITAAASMLPSLFASPLVMGPAPSPITFQITFIANNGTVSGTYSDSKGRLGSVSGTLTGTTLNVTITFISGDATGSISLTGTVTLDGSGNGSGIGGTIDENFNVGGTAYNNTGIVVTITNPELTGGSTLSSLVGIWMVPDGAGTTDSLDRDGLVFDISNDNGTWDLGNGYDSMGMTWTYSNGVMETIDGNEKITLQLHSTNDALMIRKDYVRADANSAFNASPSLTINFIRLVNGLPSITSTNTVIHNDLGISGIGTLGSGTDITAISMKKVGNILTVTVATADAPIIDESATYLCQFYADGDDNNRTAQLEYRSDSTTFYMDHTYESNGNQPVAMPTNASAVANGNSIVFTFDLSVMTPVPTKGGIISISSQRVPDFSMFDQCMSISVLLPASNTIPSE